MNRNTNTLYVLAVKCTHINDPDFTAANEQLITLLKDQSSGKKLKKAVILFFFRSIIEQLSSKLTFNIKLRLIKYIKNIQQIIFSLENRADLKIIKAYLGVLNFKYNNYNPFHYFLKDLLNAKLLLLDEEGRFIRKYPNTFCSVISGSRSKPAYRFIQTKEIIQVSTIGKALVYRENSLCLPYKISENGKVVIQQLFGRSCGWTCVVMLFMEKFGSIHIKHLFGDLSDEKDLEKFIRQYNRTPVLNYLWFNKKRVTDDLPADPDIHHYECREEKDLLNIMSDCIGRWGSAVIKVLGEIGPHFIILDCITADLEKVRIRDPYHGWEITIQTKGLLKRLYSWDKVVARPFILLHITQ